MTQSAAIYDCEGARLSDEERAFFKDIDPMGFIVFGRHCASADELRRHTDELFEAVGRDDVLILIDQEGGRVARMAPPIFEKHVPPAKFGALWRLDREKAARAAHLNGQLLGAMVGGCGVNVNCVPLLDVPQIDSDPVVMGDRAFAQHPDIVRDLGRACYEGTLAAGVLPVIKHLPGHGRSLCDSHHDLPRVSASRDDLAATDWPPFAAFSDAPLGMTAHIVYDALDERACATHSKTVVNDIIRGQIGFDGLLFTDDLKMNALGGSFDGRVRNAYNAGCDVALLCNLTLQEKRESAQALRALDGQAARRATAARGALKSAQTQASALDVQAAYAELAQLLKPVML